MQILQALYTVDLMHLAIGLLIIVFLRLLWNLHKRGTDFAELVIGDDSKLSWTKMLGCTGGVSFTWGFIYLIMHGQITEWYFNGYGLVCFGTAFAYKLNAVKAGILPQQTTTVKAPGDAAVSVNVETK
jgi:hypothetical protein